MSQRLTVVCIEAVEAEIEHPEPEVGVDQPGGDRHLLGEIVARRGPACTPERHRSPGRVASSTRRRTCRATDRVRQRSPTTPGGRRTCERLPDRCPVPNIPLTVLWYCDGAAHRTQQVQRHRRSNRRGHQVGGGRRLPIEPAADPAGARRHRRRSWPSIQIAIDVKCDRSGLG